jgi:hypothetical protein
MHIVCAFVTFQYAGTKSCKARAFGEVLTADPKQVDTANGETTFSPWSSDEHWADCIRSNSYACQECYSKWNSHGGWSLLVCIQKRC